MANNTAFRDLHPNRLIAKRMQRRTFNCLFLTNKKVAVMAIVVKAPVVFALSKKARKELFDAVVNKLETSESK